MSTYRTVAIVGVGLIGGSIGLALKKRKLADSVIGVGRRQASLDKALEIGAIDEASTDLEKAVKDAELVVVASPVGLIPKHVAQVLRSSTDTTIVTDAGSTKAAIVSQVETEVGDLATRFVGSHPLAGDHRTGPEHARDSLFDRKTVVMTPVSATAAEAIAKVESFWQNLGASVVRMTPQQHDQALAATSHLPHLVASALAATTPEEWLNLAASGWRDTTRVAAADPSLWTQIFAQNKDAVLQAAEQMAAELEQLRANLAAEDWAQLEQQLTKAKRIRDALGN